MNGRRSSKGCTTDYGFDQNLLLPGLPSHFARNGIAHRPDVLASHEVTVTVLPGKTYTPDDIVRILTRRAWLVVLPLALGMTLALVVGKRLPKKFSSETLIMVVPQRIPQSYVKAGGTENIEDRLATLQDQILSRSRLERIVLDLDLYPVLRSTLPMEDVIQRMRQDITIQTNIARSNGNDSASFRIKYVGGDAKIVQKATERLASLFIEENLRDRENIAQDTTQFLESQLEDARRRLVDQEKKLEEYRRRYSGELPTQANSNMQAIQSLQMQLQTLGEASDRARERRLLLERQLADLQLPDPVTAAPAPTEGSTHAAQPGETTAQQLERAKAELQMLLLRDTPDHPDVRMMQRRIRDLEAKQRAEAQTEAGGRSTVSQPMTAAQAIKEKRRRDLNAELEVLDRELQDKQQHEKQLRDQLATYQAKLEAIPSRESDLVALTRDYTTLQAQYQSLLAKREDSMLAANLERRNIGEQFRVLDPARAAERPFSPNVRLITAGGSGFGLFMGVLLIAFLEYRDSTFSTEDEVVRLCQLPVLALIPVMTTDDERRVTRRRRVTFNVAAALVVVAAAVVIVLSTQRF